MDYFVMLSFPRGKPIPMTCDDNGENVAWFETLEEARDAAEKNGLGDAYGYEIFCLGEGYD